MSSSEPTGDYGVVLFQSVHHALHAERLLQAAGVAIKLIPVPRKLSSDCGFCVRFAWADREQIERLLADQRVGKISFEQL